MSSASSAEFAALLCWFLVSVASESTPWARAERLSCVPERGSLAGGAARFCVSQTPGNPSFGVRSQEGGRNRSGSAKEADRTARLQGKKHPRRKPLPPKIEALLRETHLNVKHRLPYCLIPVHAAIDRAKARVPEFVDGLMSWSWRVYVLRCVVTGRKAELSRAVAKEFSEKVLSEDAVELAVRRATERYVTLLQREEEKLLRALQRELRTGSSGFPEGATSIQVKQAYESALRQAARQAGGKLGAELGNQLVKKLVTDLLVELTRTAPITVVHTGVVGLLIDWAYRRATRDRFVSRVRSELDLLEQRLTDRLRKRWLEVEEKRHELRSEAIRQILRAPRNNRPAQEPTRRRAPTVETTVSDPGLRRNEL